MLITSTLRAYACVNYTDTKKKCNTSDVLPLPPKTKCQINTLLFSVAMKHVNKQCLLDTPAQ